MGTGSVQNNYTGSIHSDCTDIGLNTLKGGKSWLPRSCVNGKMKNQHSSVYGAIACLTHLTKTAVVQSPEMNGFITPNALASFKIKKMRKGRSKFATSIKVTS